MRRSVRLMVVVFALSVHGCAVFILPCPRFKVIAPAVEGTVTRGGEPLPDRTVVYSWNWDEDRTEWRFVRETTTAEDGHFSFPAIRRFRLIQVIVPAADCGYQYRLALRDAEEESLLIMEELFGPCYDPPPHLTIDCDVDQYGEDRCDVHITGPFMRMRGGNRFLGLPEE